LSKLQTEATDLTIIDSCFIITKYTLTLLFRHIQSNRPLYSNTVISTLAADGWAVTFGIARRGL